MKHLKILTEYVEKLNQGATTKELNSKLLVNGTIYVGSEIPAFIYHLTYEWAPETVTLTIPKPMTELEKGKSYWFRDSCLSRGWDYAVWEDDYIDNRRFECGIWATEKEMIQVIEADKEVVK